jgi:predicted O-linked N-acetylglucosamine transferase (SPINDLY family)
MVVVRCALVDSCIGQQRPDAALRAVKEFSEQGSQSHAAQNAWGRALCAGGKHTEAIAHFEHALALDERSVESLNNLAHAHRMIGNLERALDAIERALALDDGRGECWNNRGLVMLEMAESSEAERCFHRAIELAEWHEASHLNHAHVAWSLGQLDESIKRLERAHEALPSSGAVRSRLLMAMHYSPRYAPKRLKAFAEDWATGMGEAGSRLERVERNKAPFRIGLVSADFREHPVGRSVRRLIPKWVAEGAEVYAYSNRPDGDDTTAAIRSECTSFRLIDALSDDAVEATIRGDRIDALVDLSGHTHGHRLAVFHRCPAPVQLTWMGFFGTTGMDCFDGVLSDQTVIPNSGGPQHTERVVHLGRCFFAVDPLDLPDVPVTPPPSLMGGGVTFGSFNNPLKYNVDVVRLWCRILDSVPGSRLLLCYPSRTPAITQAHALKMFVDAGLSAERIEVRCDLNRSQALAEYGRVDIALDPSPVNGGMTTVEAMWMGVPVLGIRGDRQSSRIGASFVEAVGHPDWTAPSEEDLIRLASSLSADEAGRVEIRKRLRIQLRRSTLCDTDGLALAALDAMRNAMDAHTQ